MNIHHKRYSLYIYSRYSVLTLCLALLLGVNWTPKAWAGNRPPFIASIPSQTVSSGCNFVSFDLNQYLSNDGDLASLAVTVSPTQFLEVSIESIGQARMVHVAYPEGWSGAETVQIKATEYYDSGFYNAYAFITFEVKPETAPCFEFVSRLEHPHSWGIDFIKKSNHIIATGREAFRKVSVTDVANPAAMTAPRYVTLPNYAAHRISQYQADTALISSYGWVVPLDITDPAKTSMADTAYWDDPVLYGNQLNWKPISDAPRYYDIIANGNLVYLAAAEWKDSDEDNIIDSDEYQAAFVKIYSVSSGAAWSRPGNPVKDINVLAYLDSLNYPAGLKKEMLEVLYDTEANGVVSVRDMVFNAAKTELFVAFSTFVIGIDLNPQSAQYRQINYFYAPGTTYTNGVPADYSDAANDYLDAVEGIALYESGSQSTLFVSTSNRGERVNTSTRRLNPTASRKGIVALNVANLASTASKVPIGSYFSSSVGDVELEIPERLLVDPATQTLYAVGLMSVPANEQVFNGVSLTRQLADSRYAKRTALQAINISNVTDGNTANNNSALKGQYVFPLQVTINGFQTSMSSCRRMILDQGKLYVGEHNYGLRIFNVSNPSQIALLGSRNLVTGESHGIVLRGTGGYLTTHHRAYPLDLSNIAQPKIVEQAGDLVNFTFPPAASNELISETKRYFYKNTSLSASPAEIAVYDLMPASGSAPQLAKLIPLNASDCSDYDSIATNNCKKKVWQVYEYKGYVYALVMDTTNNAYGKKFDLYVFQPSSVDDGKSLNLITTLNLGNFDLYGVAGAGTYAGTWLFQVKDDKVFFVVRNFTPDSNGDGYRDGENEVMIAIADVSNPIQPVLKLSNLASRMNPPMQLTDAYWFSQTSEIYHNGYLYLIGGMGTKYYDKHDPKPECRISSTASACMKRFPQLYVIRLDTTTTPYKLTTVSALAENDFPDDYERRYSAVSFMEPYEFALVQDYLYGLRLVDVSDKGSPYIVWTEPHRMPPDIAASTYPSKVPWEGGSTAGWSSGLFDGTYLYVPRLDHVDIFRLSTRGAPVAQAGSDITVVDQNADQIETVTLNASSSHDPDGWIDRYEWSENGSVIATGDVVSAQFSRGVHSVTLTVKDNVGFSSSDQILVTVDGPTNQLPIANAGADQTKTDIDRDGKETITMNANGSSDSDGTITTYTWKNQSGTAIGTGKFPKIVFNIGTHMVRLTVTDNLGGTSTDTMIVIVRSPNNAPPVANAGADQIVVDQSNSGFVAVALNGTGSTDSNGYIYSYKWTENTTNLASSSKPFISLSVGFHRITLTVTDNEGATASDTVNVTVQASSGSSHMPGFLTALGDI